MYTRCPHCSAVFRVSTALLAQAGGQARCGECHETYTVLEHLYEDVDAARATGNTEPSSGSAEDVAEPGDEHAAAAADGAGFAVADAGIDDRDDTDATGTDTEEQPLRHQPLLSGWRQQGPGVRDVMTVFLMLLLVGMLGMQWIYFNRARLAADPAWRAGLEPVCHLLHCKLPLQVALDKLTLVARDVRRHPNVPSALLINASFENDAGFTQPYPWLEVSFSNRAGEPVAMRRFSPAEYLVPGTAIDQGLASRAVARARLEILDPGEEAASFQFEFL